MIKYITLIFPIVFWVSVIFFRKRILKILKDPIYLIKKIISLGFEGMWEFIKPYIKWVIIVLVLVSLVPSQVWEKMKLLKELFGYTPKTGIAVIISVLITWPLQIAVRLCALIIFPVLWIRPDWLSGLLHIKGLIFLLWIGAIYKAASKQHQRSVNKSIKDLKKEKEKSNETN